MSDDDTYYAPDAPEIQPDARWPFGMGELTAALRRHLHQPSLVVTDVQQVALAESVPTLDHLRGVEVTVHPEKQPDVTERHQFLLKEPQGTSRKGLAGVGRREVGFYRFLAREVTVQLPHLVATHPLGRWLLFAPNAAHFDPSGWQAEDYLHGIETLARLHDRFWQLGNDLNIHAWLGRPLTNDFEVHLIAAESALRTLVHERQAPGIADDISLLTALSQMLTHADRIVAELNLAPETLLNGNYWPGTVGLLPTGEHLVSDWQSIGIGPGILDVAQFIQRSRYWLDDDLPIAPADLLAHYRANISQRALFDWYDAAWQRQWDFALLWLFMQDWLGLLAVIPAPVWRTRQAVLESVWLNPIAEAVSRQLGDLKGA